MEVLLRSWEDWLKRTGELPPDFDAVPSKPFLVDPPEDLRTPELEKTIFGWLNDARG